MEKPFDVSIDELAHGLALMSVSELARGKNFNHEEYYDEYISELHFFKETIRKQLKAD